jgi:hypothetical protein
MGTLFYVSEGITVDTAIQHHIDTIVSCTSALADTKSAHERITVSKRCMRAFIDGTKLTGSATPERKAVHLAWDVYTRAYVQVREG